MRAAVAGRRIPMLLAGVMVVCGAVMAAAAESRFGEIFLDVRASAERHLAAAEARLIDPLDSGFGVRYYRAIEPTKQRLVEALADESADDAQLLRATAELNLAINRYERARELRASVDEAVAMARAVEAEPAAAGFGARYHESLPALAEVPLEVLKDDEATLEQMERATREIDEAVANYEAVSDIRSRAEDAIEASRLVERYATEGFFGFANLDSEAVSELRLLRDELAPMLEERQATIEAVESRIDALVDALDEIGDPLEEPITDAINQPRRAFPEGTREEQYEQVDAWSLPTDGWRFRRDRSRLGYFERWYAAGHDDSDWQAAGIETFWRTFLGEMYVGPGWYRAEIDIPEMRDYDALALQFGAVDHEGWVWIDGEYLGQHDERGEGLSSGELWNRPFQLDATGVIEPGRTHQITVRVRNTGGNGGIHQPVRVVAYRKVE